MKKGEIILVSILPIVIITVLIGAFISSKTDYITEQVEIKQCINTEDHGQICWYKETRYLEDCGELYELETDYYDQNLNYYPATSTYRFCFKKI